MCVVSMTGDFFRDRWTDPQQPYKKTIDDIFTWPQGVSQDEFNKLKEEVKLLKELLKKSKEYDEKNNEPDCEIDEKMELLRKVAQAVGIDLDDVIKKKTSS